MVVVGKGPAPSELRQRRLQQKGLECDVVWTAGGGGGGGGRRGAVICFHNAALNLCNGQQNTRPLVGCMFLNLASGSPEGTMANWNGYRWGAGGLSQQDGGACLSVEKRALTAESSQSKRCCR